MRGKGGMVLGKSSRRGQSLAGTIALQLMQLLCDHLAFMCELLSSERKSMDCRSFLCC